MVTIPTLKDPWFLPVWPGMGRVALKAGEYLAKELEMEYVGRFPADEFFDLSHVSVKDGIARPGNRPRCLLVVWRDPRERNDLVVLLGESQPSERGYELCQRIMRRAREWGVTRVLAFAAMATQMHPRQEARVFGAATDRPLLDEMKGHGVDPLSEGQVSGLNGLMLAAAQDNGVEAGCLLGELPYFAVQVPNPKASRAVLRVFTEMAGIDLDFTGMDEEVEEVDEQLTRLLEHLKRQGGELGVEDEEEGPDFGVGGEFPHGAIAPDLADEEEDEEELEEGPAELAAEEQQRVERLFAEAARDRSKATELKRELDRLGVFQEYENRFLDLFRQGD